MPVAMVVATDVVPTDLQFGNFTTGATPPLLVFVDNTAPYKHAGIFTATK